MGKAGSVRERILEAALRTLQEGGVKKLTQPKVAAAAGVRQSHLTYYFPKKNDMVIALLQGHIDHASARLDELEDGPVPEDIGSATDTLVSDRKRMRFFLGLIIEADGDPRLRKMVDAHIRQFNALIARYYGRDDEDRDVEAFLNALRGYGMANLLHRGAPLEPVPLGRSRLMYEQDRVVYNQAEQCDESDHRQQVHRQIHDT